MESKLVRSDLYTFDGGDDSVQCLCCAQIRFHASVFSSYRRGQLISFTLRFAVFRFVL